jgi:hypothetical protein
MKGKVALEEHFAIAETLKDSAVFSPEADWPELKARLTDIHDRRLPTIISPSRFSANPIALAALLHCRCRARMWRRGSWNAASANSGFAGR